jgi:hypothetical protein
MRLILIGFTNLLLVSAGTFAQGDYKLTGYGIEYGTTMYWLMGNDYQDFTGMVDDPSFFSGDDSVNWHSGGTTRNKAPDYRMEVIFQTNSDKPRMVKAGVQYDSGISRNLFRWENEDYVIDTVTVSYSGSGETYTVYQDCTAYENVTYQVHSRNIGVYGEYLVGLNKNKRHQLFAGLGLGVGYSVSQQVSRTYYNYWVDHYVNQSGGPEYYAVYPVYSPVAGSLILYNLVEREVTTTKCNKTLYASPYVPISVRTQAWPTGFFGKVYLNLSATAGARFGITRAAGIDVRPFYSLRAGLSYLF